MRLLGLDLERYGPFSGLGLAFRPDARLHVVYGANEAGKSCALAAVTDLLFGFEHRTAYDFLHPQDSLRIGAEIVATDGRRLAFRRRKGRKNTLVDAADAPLDDAVLAPFLGGLTREVFCHAFGLSTEALRAGGREMERAEGDAGAQFLAAGSGLKGLIDIRRAIEAEADDIFTHQGRQRRLNQLLREHEEARNEKSRADLLPSRWKTLNEAVDSLDAAWREARAARDGKRAEQRALERLVAIEPLLGEIDAGLARRAALGPLPDLAAGEPERLQALLDAAAAAGQEAALRAAAARAAAAELAAIRPDDRLLAKAGAIEALVAGSGAHAQDRRVRPEAAAEADEEARRLDRLAARLGFAETAAMLAARPSDAVLAGLAALMREGRALIEAEAALGRTLAAETQTLAALPGAAAAVPDPAPLAARRATLAPVLRRLDRRAEWAAEIAEDGARLAASAARLAPPVGDLAGLAARPWPAPETQRRFDAELAALDAAIGRAGDERDRRRGELAAVEAELAALTRGGPVPTRAAIEAARARRDQAWAALRPRLFGLGPPIEPGALAALVAAYEAAAAEADRLADAAMHDAARVAAHADKSRLAAETAARLEAAAAALAELDRRWQEANRAWAALWAPAGIAPLRPKEMLAWSERVAALVADHDRLEADRLRLAELDRAIAAVEPELRAIAAAAGIAAAETVPVALLAARLDERLAEMAQAFAGARDAATRKSALGERIARLGAERDEAAAALVQWRQRAAAALPAIGLPPGAGPDEAEAALAAWAELPDRLARRDKARARLQALDAAIARFEAAAAALAGEIAPDLADYPAGALAEALNARLTEARAGAVSRAEADRRRIEAERRAEAAAAAARDAHAALHAALAAAGLDDGPDLPDRLGRLIDAAAIDRTVAEARHRLVQVGGEGDEAALRAALEEFDRARALATIEDLAREAERLEEEANRLYAEREQARHERDERRKGIGAELAVQQRLAAEAGIREAARDWAVLRAAALMIGAAIERHRAGRQNPLMRRAGELFAILTGGSFVDLGTVYDEADEPRLAGLRADGRLVPAGGRSRDQRSPMSEGTLDQLYLAIRLAHLEDYAARAEPAPFLGDDLFASFDEERTKRGLDVLAAIGGTVQPILFTHHRHIAEIAEARLGPAVDVIALG